MDVDSEQAAADSRGLARSLRTLVSIVAANMSQEGRSLFHDFASFMRLTIADAADQLGDSAHSTAEVLRDVDTDVQDGKRNELGIKRKADTEPEDADARAKFERVMDSTKEVGSKAIGVGQAAVAAAARSHCARTGSQEKAPRQSCSLCQRGRLRKSDG